MRLTAEQRDQAIAAVAHSVTGRIVEMRASGGGELDSARRSALLAAAVAREDVELEVDILAFEQKTGERNYNCFRFRDGAMMALGRSGEGTPFLRDHKKYDSEAVGGTITKSRTEKVAEGHYRILQTATLREPKAVERALRGLIHAVSIGARATGPVECSLCGTPVFEDCYHWAGDEVEGEDGSVAIVEWVYTSAVLWETSECPIGAVPTAGPQSIRAAIEAAANGGGPRPLVNKDSTMNLREALAAALSLAATAGDTEIIAAVNGLVASRAELTIANAELGVLRSERDQLRAAQQATAADEFVRAALAEGKIAAGEDEKLWRAMFAASEPRARELMTARAAGCATPVGQARQSVVTAAAAPAGVAPTGTQAAAAAAPVNVEAALKEHGYDPAAIQAQLSALGSKDPKKTLENAAARETARRGGN
jgi:hypothetical protein